MPPKRGLKVVVTPGVHRLTRTVGSNEPGALAGDVGPMPYSFTGPNLERVPASLRRGSWLFLDHAGRGVQYGRDHAIAGVVIETLGFLRPHATPGASSWSPGDADYDIVGSNCDLLVRDTLHLCSPRGLLHNYGGYGRFEAERVRGQFFEVGIRLAGEFDLPRIRDCHFWPFWSQDPTVTRHMRDRLEAIQFDGVDGVFLSDFFCIGANRALAYYQTGGHADRVHQATNLYTDVGGTGIYVDPGVTQGITLDIANWMCNAFVPDAMHPPTTSRGVNAWALDVRGDRCEIAVTGMRAEWMPDGLVRLMGEGNVVQVGVYEAFRWNRNGNGSAAFDCGRRQPPDDHRRPADRRGCERRTGQPVLRRGHDPLAAERADRRRQRGPAGDDDRGGPRPGPAADGGPVPLLVRRISGRGDPMLDRSDHALAHDPDRRCPTRPRHRPGVGRQRLRLSTVTAGPRPGPATAMPFRPARVRRRSAAIGPAGCQA